jgi:quercetin dioxygenase-like cupin family protein
MNNAKYVRLYTDENGESHFTEANVGLSPTDFAPPAPPLGVSDGYDAERMIFVGGPTGWAGDWHVAPKRQFVICLTGEFEITASDGESRAFRSGDILLLEDVTGKGHKTRIIERAVTVMVQLE